MKKIKIFIASIFLMTLVTQVNTFACMNAIPPPVCPEPACSSDDFQDILKWKIESKECDSNKAVIRFRNLKSMGGDSSHTCTCAVGSTSNIFANVIAFSFVYAGTTDVIPEFDNWANAPTNEWDNATGFAGGYTIAGFTAGIVGNLPGGISMDVLVEIGLEPGECSNASINNKLADVKLGVDEWDNAAGAPAGNSGGANAHQSVGSAVQNCDCQNPVDERAEMIKLRNYLQLDPFVFPKWYSSKPMSHWEGVKAVGDCYVLKINLRNQNMTRPNITGTLPPDLNLQHLVVFNLGYNAITGGIPNYENLSCVTHFNVRDNQLSGPVPPFDYFYSLEILRLQVNDLSGNLPTLEYSPNLQIFNARSNWISGTIPNYDHFDMWRLRLWDNKLTGAVPNFDLPSINSLLLHKNCLTELPHSFTMIPTVVQFTLQKNKFDFDDLETVVEYYTSIGSPYFFNYSPQPKIPITFNSTDSILAVHAGGTLSKNTYTWFKGGTQIAQITGDNEYTANVKGNYKCHVTNSCVPDLTLKTNAYYVGPAPASQALFKEIELPNSILTKGELENTNLSIYPNPSRGMFAIHLPEHKTDVEKISIYNARGKIIYEETYTVEKGNTVQFDISFAPKGVYFIELLSGTNSSIERLIKN